MYPSGSFLANTSVDKGALSKTPADYLYECGCLCALFHLRKSRPFLFMFLLVSSGGRRGYINIAAAGLFPSSNTLLLLFVEPKWKEYVLMGLSLPRFL